jgi:hypothetical protein
MLQGGYAKSVDSFCYANEMNPKLKGKKVPLLDAEPEPEYVPPPFNANSAEVRSFPPPPLHSKWMPITSGSTSKKESLGRIQPPACCVLVSLSKGSARVQS